VFHLGTEWFMVSYLNRVDAFVTRIVPLIFLYDCSVVQFDDVVGEIVYVRGPFGAYNDKIAALAEDRNLPRLIDDAGGVAIF
jgi:hypothetical protein